MLILLLLSCELVHIIYIYKKSHCVYQKKKYFGNGLSMVEDEEEKFIDELAIERVIPNFGDLDMESKKKCLEDIYIKQSNKTFANPLGTNLYGETVASSDVRIFEGFAGVKKNKKSKRRRLDD